MISWKFNKKDVVFSKLNGSEPKYDDKKWNDNLKIKKTHNCYAYVLDIIKESLTKKPQPGYYSGYSYLTDDDIRTCDKMFGRIKSDNESMFKINFRDKCPDGYRKGYLAVDDGKNTDYHFYRLDSDGSWSHKPGSTPAIQSNSDGKIITAPHSATRKSSSHNYNKSCGYFCFDPKKTNISNKPSNRRRIK